MFTSTEIEVTSSLGLGLFCSNSKGFSGEEFMAHYDTLIKWIHEASPHCAILFTTTTDNYVRKKGPNKRSNTAEYCIQKLTQDQNAAMWDMYGIMGGYKSILKWYKAKIARKDKVHFTARGYYIFADMMFDAIMKSYHNSYKN